jgi:hypothetical protein
LTNECLSLDKVFNEGLQWQHCLGANTAVYHFLRYTCFRGVGIE